MHSSRMRTVRNSSRLLEGGASSGGLSAPGGVPAPGGSAPGGLPAPGGSAPGGCLLPGGGVVSEHALRQTPPPHGQSHRCKNIADGNNAFQ